MLRRFNAVLPQGRPPPLASSARSDVDAHRRVSRCVVIGGAGMPEVRDRAGAVVPRTAATTRSAE